MLKYKVTGYFRGEKLVAMFESKENAEKFIEKLPVENPQIEEIK